MLPSQTQEYFVAPIVSVPVETLLSDELADEPETLSVMPPPLSNHVHSGAEFASPLVVQATTGLPRKMSRKSGTSPTVRRKPGAKLPSSGDAISSVETD